MHSACSGEYAFDSSTPSLEPLCVAVLSPFVPEARVLASLTACSSEIRHLIKAVEQKLWQQACALSRQTAFAPCAARQNVSCWFNFLRERTPRTDREQVRVLGEQDLQVCEQLDWAALIAVVGPFRSGKSALIHRLVRQEAPGQNSGIRWPPMGGVRACVLEAFRSRGRLRLFEIDAGAMSTSAHLLCKADVIFVVCDQSEGVQGASEAMQLVNVVQDITTRQRGGPPCFLVFSKSDLTKSNNDVFATVKDVASHSASLLSGCEIVSVSAMDGAGIDLLLHLLAWRLLVCSKASRHHLLDRGYHGGLKLLHRTAGAMNPQEVLSAMLQRRVVEVA